MRQTHNRNSSGKFCKVSLQDKFWCNVRVSDANQCWEWTAPVCGGEKYGRFYDNNRRIQAHIASWVIHNGPVDEGKFVLHKCDNPLCVNPNHLFIGTASDNMRDMVAKGRFVGGTKLKEGEVWLIKILLKSKLLYQKDIAKMFRVNRNTITAINVGKRWEKVQL